MERIEDRTERVRTYQERYLPEGMRSQKKVNLVISAGMELMYARQANIEGIENLPEKGPFIIVANHFNLKETEILLALLKNYDAHVIASEKVHGEHPVRGIGLRAIRGLTAPDSLAHLTPEEKTALLERVSDDFVKQKYQEIIEREEAGEVDRSGLIELIRSSVALLSRGDVLVIYPEGLWLYDGEEGAPRSHSLYKGYDGFAVIAEQYKRLTSEDVPIVPIGFYEEGEKKQVKIGNASTLQDNDTELSNTDWYMGQIAEQLPEEQRGYYAQKSQSPEVDNF
ncbi:1-acyl-sn-glycerol-3-phosphate acyltransferase [Candidatus Kaiserbacteria bacterium]|nr:1-acyl-sn-glycerol-3-phosphate acyltransferase [Candidatus Kaiserbacteria bacterium]USN92381.1 MAG: 1-acyl-sn-glycerol-3-phosphate acyltransferase [Candidatus Nomurabacteria bacterium]